MTGKQLKNSILQWAIQGKLVPQDPNDEPASVLLEKIRAEKARLIKEGKIKKDKKESIIYRGEDNSYYEKFADGKVACIDEEIPFEIPNGWEWCRLGNLITYQNGYAYSSSEMNKDKRGLPVIKSGNLMSLEVVLKPHNDYIEYPTPKMLASKIVCGDLLMCLSSQSDNPEPLGKTAIYKFDFPSLLNQRVLKFRPYFDCLSPYLYNVINSFYFHYGVSHQGGGSAQANLKVEHVIGMLIPLAPQKEQSRIVKRIDELQPYISRYSISKENADFLNDTLPIRLKKSILQEAIQGKLVPQDSNDEPATTLLQRIKEEKQRLIKEGKLKKKDIIDSTIFRGDDNKYYEQIGKNLIDITGDIPFDIPSNWVWTRIGYLFAHNNGKQLNKGNSVGTLMEYITTSNLYWDGFRLDNLKMMPFEESEIERCQAIKGDLLVCEGGDVGRSCIWTYDYPIMLQNHIHKLRAYLPLCTKYFFYIFYLYNLIGLIGGKGIGIQGFSAKALHNTIIPLPPLNEQERIVKKIEIVFNKIKSFRPLSCS